MNNSGLFKKISVSILLSSFSFLSHAETVFTVAYEDKVQFPYYMGNTSKVLTEKPGAAVELIQLIESKIPGVKVVLKRCPWKRCLKDMEKGIVDGAFNASFKEKRLKFGAYPWKADSVDSDRRLTTIAYYFYKKKGTDFVWDGKSISGNKGKIGAPAGYSIVGDLKKMGAKVSEAASSEKNLKKLLSGRVSAVALQEVTGDYYIKKDAQFSDIEKVEPALKTKPYYLMISNQFKNNNPDMAEKIWNAVGELREEKLNSLTDKYFN
jgi:polar amino acid transport system substrate-binding protein